MRFKLFFFNEFDVRLYIYKKILYTFVEPMHLTRQQTMNLNTNTFVVIKRKFVDNFF